VTLPTVCGADTRRWAKGAMSDRDGRKQHVAKERNPPRGCVRHSLNSRTYPVLRLERAAFRAMY
jgi:hypothetical protein